MTGERAQGETEERPQVDRVRAQGDGGKAQGGAASDYVISRKMKIFHHS